MVARPDLDPDELKQAMGRKPEHEPKDLLAVLPDAGLENARWLKLAGEEGIAPRMFYRLRKGLVKSNQVLKSLNGRWLPITKAKCDKCDKTDLSQGGARV